VTADAPTVLFVDDDQRVVDGLRRMLRGKARDWQLLVATSGEEALRILAEQQVDAVVSDMRMPGMNGAQLLAAVQRDYPATARIILSGQAERGAVLEAVASAQQFLAKPCDVGAVVAAVRRAVSVRRMLTDGRLQEIIGGIGSLPKPPGVYQELVAVVSSQDFELADVAHVLDGHVATRAEVLRLVNTAFFGLPRHVDTVENAVALLGLDNIQALVLASSLFHTGGPVPRDLDPAALQAAGLRRAAVVRRLAVLEGLERHVLDTVVLAALLRDVGLLVLAGAMPEQFAELTAAATRAGATTPAELAPLEREAFGCTVTEASACLLGLWGFAELMVHMLATQPVAGDDDGASVPEHVLAAADLRCGPGAPEIPATPDGYVDEARAARWNTTSEEALTGTPTPTPA
jgi:HD-like signal output (HDOD) protein/CheY-like chemotaxis protein